MTFRSTRHRPEDCPNDGPRSYLCWHKLKCEVCGADFHSGRSDTRTCSDRCRQMRARRRRGRSPGT